MNNELTLSEMLDELERRYGVDEPEQTDEEIEWLNILSEAEHNK